MERASRVAERDMAGTKIGHQQPKNSGTGQWWRGGALGEYNYIIQKQWNVTVHSTSTVTLDEGA